MERHNALMNEMKNFAPAGQNGLSGQIVQWIVNLVGRVALEIA